VVWLAMCVFIYLRPDTTRKRYTLDPKSEWM
jgi:hypothetical protein